MDKLQVGEVFVSEQGQRFAVVDRMQHSQTRGYWVAWSRKHVVDIVNTHGRRMTPREWMWDVATRTQLKPGVVLGTENGLLCLYEELDETWRELAFNELGEVSP